MKCAKISKSGGLLVLVTLASPLAMADGDAGWYIGANVGHSTTNIDNKRIYEGLSSKGFATTSLTGDDADTGYKLFGGYQFNQSLALEGGYFDLGSFGFKATTLPPGTLTGDIRVKGINLDLVGTHFLTQRFALLGRIGVTQTRAEDRFRGTGAVTVADPNPSSNRTNYKFGVGVQYAMTDALSLRAEAERYRVNDAIDNNGDIDLYSLGLTYRFGTKRQQMASNEKVVVLATEPQAEEKVQEAVAEHKVIILAFEDVHFNFDKSTLTPKAKTILDRNITLLKNNPGAEIRVAGYTSAQGTREYNQKLSERRARAVKAYLIKEGITPKRLSVIGYGERSPAEYEAAPGNLYSNAAKANMRVLFEVVIQ